MSKTLLIIISGPPGSGKTTLGEHLARELRLPFIHKDGIKELLFDTLGWSDRAWSRKLGAATYELLYHFMEALLSVGCSFIVESNFDAKFSTGKFLELKAKYGFEPLQMRCVADGEVLFQRFKERAESGKRHPGHVEYLNFEEFKPALLRGRDEVMDIGGSVLEVDTTDFDRVEYGELIEAIKEMIRSLP